ncbi:MAG: hypothetical protein IJ757_05380 [Clostridiales bacterium]|nr:hypothetical protein [Clostridiales bacterium]
MNTRKTIAVAVALSVVLAAGCAKNDDKDIEKLEQIPQEFLDALADEDYDELEQLVYGYSREQRNNPDNNYIRDFQLRAASLASIEDEGEVIIHRDDLTAEMDITVSYIDMDEFALYALSELQYSTLDEYLEALDRYEDRVEEEVPLEFVYDEEEDEWYLSRRSAGRISGLFTSSRLILIEPVQISATEAREIFEATISELCGTGTAEAYTQVDIDVLRVYDNTSSRGQSAETYNAVRDFVRAYMTYVMEHDHEIVESDPYYLSLEGVAPSADYLSSAICTDEFMTQYLINGLRYSYLGLSLDEMWDLQSILIYNTLTEAIASAPSEAYTLSGHVQPYPPDNYYSESVLTFYDDIIPEPSIGIYEAEHGISQDQYMRCMEVAINALHDSGEMPDDMYDEMISEFTPENYGYVEDDTVSPSGHPNQALGVIEQTPEWSDGSLVYGYSNTDENGFWMFYSKQPGWLDTVGYYIDEEGIWITNYYDRPFAPGTELIVDWWIDDVQVVDTQIILVEAGEESAIEVYLPTDGFPSQGVYEMRLWESNHTHVIAYVTLTNEQSNAATWRNT